MSKGLPRSMSRGAPQRQHIRKQTIIVRDFEMTVTGGASTAVGTGTVVIGDFPEGNILFLGAMAYMQFSGTGSLADLAADWEGDYSIGTAPNADADLDDAAEVNIITKTAIAAATAEVSPRTRGVSAASAVFDNTDGSLEINLSLITDDNDVTDSTAITMTVDGELYISYIVLGDD